MLTPYPLGNATDGSPCDSHPPAYRCGGCEQESFPTSGWNSLHFAAYRNRTFLAICDKYNSLFLLFGVTDPKCLAARMPSIVAESGGNGHALTIV